MGTSSKVVTLTTESRRTIAVRSRVCIHVLREARADIRVVRAASALAAAGYAVSALRRRDQPHPRAEGRSGRRSPGTPHRARLAHLQALRTVVPARRRAHVHAQHLPAVARTRRHLSRQRADRAARLLHRRTVAPQTPGLRDLRPAISGALYPNRLLASPGRLPVRTAFTALCRRDRDLTSARQRGAATLPRPRNSPGAQRSRLPAGQQERSPAPAPAPGPDVRLALYQGNIQSDRGLDRLVLAAPFLEPGTVIVLMGKGIGTTQSELEQLIDRLGVADRVRIIPPVPYADLLDWTRLRRHRPDHLYVGTLTEC